MAHGTILLLLLLLLAPRALPAQEGGAQLPDTPTGAHAAALFRAIAAGTEEAARAFIDQHMDPDFVRDFPMEQHLGMFRSWNERFGRVTVTSYRVVSPTEMEVEFRPENGSGARLFVLEFAAAPPHGLVGLQGRPAGAPAGGPAADPGRTVDAALRLAVVDSVAAAMERYHLFPDTGAAIAGRLRERARAGAYDGARTAQQLAGALTQDVQAVNPDRHVNVRPTTGEMQAGGPAGGGRPAQVGRVERLAGNVGYLQLAGVLGGSPQALEEVAAAFRELGDTRAMIVDLRNIPGGSAEMANLIVSHFVAPRTHTITRVTPASNDTMQIYTMDEVPGPRRTDVPLYVLVNGGSASAAEHVPFVLQNLGRATIVGERTPGAGRNNRFVPVGNGFSISVSFTRVTDPRTGREWERVGVQPDLEVPSAQALTAAHRAALEALLARAPDAGTRAELQRALDTVPATTAASPPQAAAGQGSPEVLAVLEPVRAEQGVPALAAAVVRDGAVVAAGATGVRRLGEPASVALTDRFYVGSLTKLMTDMLIGTLVDGGKLRWEATLGELFPELRETMTPAFHGATLEQLLTHRAGLPTFTRLGPAEAQLFQSITGTPVEQRARFAAWLLAQEPVAQPGTDAHYSNAGYALAGAIAERAGGRPWEELMQERVFAPLGIRSAGFGVPAQLEPGQPWGHVGEPGAYTAAQGFGPTTPIMRPAGGTSMTIEDLARFAAGHIAEVSGAGRVLRPETARRVHDTRDATFAGGNGMHTAMIALRPEAGAAIVVATNSGGPAALQEVIRRLR